MTVSPIEEKLRAVRDLLDGAIAEGLLPGAVFAFGGLADAGYVEAVGFEEPAADAATTHLDTIYDLASLTKVIATLPTVLCLAATGKIALDAPVARYLPDFSRGMQAEVTVRHLLAHTSGLAQAPRYYRTLGDAAQAWAAILAEQPVRRPGTTTVYSDVGFMLLGLIVETITSSTLDAVAQQLVFRPLGMARTGFRPLLVSNRIAPTEVFDTGPAMRGIVHDRNAALLDRAAGHAGLFGPVGDVVRYLRAWRGSAECPWTRPFATEALTPQNLATGSAARGLGWALADPAYDTFMSERWPAGGAGHTGFTGTSMAFDSRGPLWAVLLTNAIRCGRHPERINALRQEFHRIVAGAP